jgi:excisionase family DNA binding protein
MRSAEKPKPADQKLAKATFELIRKERANYPTKRKSRISLHFTETNTRAQLPDHAIPLIEEMLKLMAEGKPFSIIPTDSALSSQEAADLLQVSRPHIVHLMEEGKIPYYKVGSHRRVLEEDLVTYQRDLKITRESNLTLIAKQAQEDSLGY